MEIILNTNAFSEEEKQQIEPQLRDLINNLSASLDTTSLKKS